MEEELGHMEWKVGSVGASECEGVYQRKQSKGGRLLDVGTSF